MPNTATRRKLALRDCGCVVPGCDRPASWTVPHHVVHHADGGTSELSNLVLLCSRHHWMVHEGGRQLIVAEDGRILMLPHSEVPRARPPTPSAA
ncbi:MAG: HNH endonuclease [Candidatus Dormibacteraeota bacterium]|nr:HNH endonuclease [Candidatus Dormibacteraeota bacterium]